MLAGLPAHYNMMVTVLTATQTDISLDDILPKLLQVETQQQADLRDERALTARHGNGFNDNHTGRRGHFGRVGHIERYCRKKERDEAANSTLASKVYSAIAL